MKPLLLLLFPLFIAQPQAGTSESKFAQAIENEEQAPAMKNKTETKNGIKTKDVNTSPNKAPATDREVIEGATLHNTGIPEDAVIKQEEESREQKVKSKIIRPIMP